MIADRNKQILPRVRQQCADCPECDPEKLETVLLVLAMTTSIVNVPGVKRVKGSIDAYAVAVNGARLEFRWSEPYATDLNLICPEATE